MTTGDLPERESSPPAHPSPAHPSPSHPGRRELALVLVLGAAGAGLVLLAAHQGWARVDTAAPSPLPDSVTTATGQALVPAAGALALAALAGLAAVLATRRIVRRVAGVVLAGLGAGIAVAISAGISAAAVLAAASAGAQTTAGAATGSAIGSTTGGGPGAGASGGTPVSGFPGHVIFVSFPWRGVAFAGALAVVAAGALVAWRADRLPVMSSRYEPPAATAATAERGGPAGREPAAAVREHRPRGSDTAAIWESLSRGEDPTSTG
jgi:uncharacterized membrane protein (TIGR02234 family)